MNAYGFTNQGGIYTFPFFTNGALVARIVISGWKTPTGGTKMLFGYMYLYDREESKLYNGFPVDLTPVKSGKVPEHIQRLRNALNK